MNQCGCSLMTRYMKGQSGTKAETLNLLESGLFIHEALGLKKTQFYSFYMVIPFLINVNDGQKWQMAL